MWYIMENVQEKYNLSERLIRAISNWCLPDSQDDVEDLLEQGADVNGQHGTLLPLHCACMVNDEECVQLFLDRGAQMNKLDGYGRAALHYAAERRGGGCLKILLNHFHDQKRPCSISADVNICDASYATPLHWASFKNNAVCVRMLLERGADVNAVEINNDTPLSWAAQRGSLESIRVLLDYNARTDTRNFYGRSPLDRELDIHVIGLSKDSDDACLALLTKASRPLELYDENTDVVKGILEDSNSKDARLSELRKHLSENMNSLRHLTRFSIRKYLGPCYLPDVIPQLPIPTLLQEYLLLQH